MLNRLIVGLLVIKIVGRVACNLRVAHDNAVQLEAYSAAMTAYAAGQNDLYGLFRADRCPPS